MAAELLVLLFIFVTSGDASRIRMLMDVDAGPSWIPGQLDPRAWAPFLPPSPPFPPPAIDASAGIPPSPPSIDEIAPAPAEPPLRKPSAVVLPSSWIVDAAPDASSSPIPSLAAGIHSVDTDRRINKGVILTFILVPTLLGGSILLSTVVTWMCQRPPSLRHGCYSHGSTSSHFGSSKHSSSGGPFAPWLWGRSFTGPPVELASSFDYILLQTATNNFSSGNLLGEGSSGRIYKARLDEDTFAAVKLLHSQGKPASEQGFQAEVEFLSKIRHPNLVSLLGFCSNGENRLLVYEYMQNGSLQDQLHGPSRGSALTWFLRMKIALDSARGLEHLHEQCSPLVIHRDFKSSNILVDASFNAKVADFGLALAAPSGMRRDAGVQGTLGYVAPEYMLNGSLTEKSDVYAFGIVLLELITGRKPIDPTGCESLVSWVMPLLADRSSLPTVVDPVLRETIDPKHLHQVAAVAVLCVQNEPSYRPLIADVVNSLIPLVPVELGGSLTVLEATMMPANKSFAALQWHSSSSMSSDTDCIEEHDIYYT